MGVAKLFGTTPESALHDISYANAMMYSRAMPAIGDESDDGEAGFDESLDANNPDNFNGITDEEEETIA